VVVCEAGTYEGSLSLGDDCEILARHAEFGCLSLWCVTAEASYPFVFHRRNFKGVVPGAQLIYCRDTEDFTRFAQPLGKYLARRGLLFVRIDANGPIPGLVGRYFDGMEPRYHTGATPRLGDLAFTQTVMVPYARRRR
jgi:hypothetical protein